MADQEIDEITGIDTTGHDWDGIKELNNPLPRWWLWTFYATIAWGLWYTIAYPAWPLFSSATQGYLNYSTRQEVAAEIARFDAQNADVSQQLASANLAGLDKSGTVFNFGISGGAAVFRANCSQCHGAGAAGALGYPNLLDDDWLWGGDLASIEHSIRYGIRNSQDEDAHYSEMPVFGEVLEEAQVDQITHFVMSLSKKEHTSTAAANGATLFKENCASCHGEIGEGIREQGAPKLNDAIWLYGGSYEAIKESITNARFGVMPAWGKRLSDADVKAVTLYVHQLGGGE